jgi:signal transduction histidine kinase
LFFAAAGLCSWYYGLASGLVSIALDGLALAYFVLPPTRSLRVADAVDVIRLAVFLAASIAIAVVVAKFRSTQRELARAHERFQLAHRIARIYCWELDVASGEVIWSAGGESEREFRKADLKAHFQRIHPEDREKLTAALKNAVDTEGRYEIEYRVLVPDNGIRWMASLGEFYRSSTGGPCVLGVNVDITARKEGEESRQAAAKGELAGELAHEINNPLQSLLHALYLVHEEADDSPLGKYTAIAQSEAERVSTLVKQILRLYHPPSSAA